MAEALELLDEQLECGVCLDQYTNPKTLQCHHSFCLKCIELLPMKKQVKYIRECIINFYKKLLIKLVG